MKNGLLIFFLLVHNLKWDEVCIFWHVGTPGTPGFYGRAHHDPEEMKKNKLFLKNLNQKIIIRLLPYLSCKLI